MKKVKLRFKSEKVKQQLSVLAVAFIFIVYLMAPFSMALHVNSVAKDIKTQIEVLENHISIIDEKLKDVKDDVTDNDIDSMIQDNKITTLEKEVDKLKETPPTPSPEPTPTPTKQTTKTAKSTNTKETAKKAAPKVETVKEKADGNWKSLGKFRLTAYCPCAKCCGRQTGITASGAKAVQGVTIGVDPKRLPYGTKVKIRGHVYTAQDCGSGVNGNAIDIFFNSHKEALKFGMQYAEVFVRG